MPHRSIRQLRQLIRSPVLKRLRKNLRVIRRNARRISRMMRRGHSRRMARRMRSGMRSSMVSEMPDHSVRAGRDHADDGDGAKGDRDVPSADLVFIPVFALEALLDDFDAPEVDVDAAGGDGGADEGDAQGEDCAADAGARSCAGAEVFLGHDGVEFFEVGAGEGGDLFGVVGLVEVAELVPAFAHDWGLEG